MKYAMSMKSVLFFLSVEEQTTLWYSKMGVTRLPMHYALDLLESESPLNFIYINTEAKMAPTFTSSRGSYGAGNSSKMRVLMIGCMSMSSSWLSAHGSSLANRVLLRIMAMILINGFLIMDCLAPHDEYDPYTIRTQTKSSWVVVSGKSMLSRMGLKP